MCCVTWTYALVGTYEYYAVRSLSLMNPSSLARVSVKSSDGFSEDVLSQRCHKFNTRSVKELLCCLAVGLLLQPVCLPACLPFLSTWLLYATKRGATRRTATLF